jgi:hypothetical protein
MVFVVLVLLLTSIGGSSNPRILHVILLFAVCSTWVIDLDGLNGKYALLAIFLSFYFVSYGLLDVGNLLSGVSSETVPSLFSPTEGVILAGAVMLTLGYRSAATIQRTTSRRSTARDWPWKTALILGIAIWLIGTAVMLYWNLYIFTDASVVTGKKALASVSPIATAGILVANLFQPFGILLVAYAWRSKGSILIQSVLIAMVCGQIIFGFVIDVKGEALIGGILVIVTYVLLEGRLPIGWIAAAVVFVIFGFPVLQAGRFVVHNKLSRTAILENLGSAVKLAMESEDRLSQLKDRPQTLLERTSVRGSIQMIVEKTGNGVPFQHGYTLTPLLGTFIPRIISSDKVSIETGRLLNREFHVSDSEDLYLSPSIPGELYWNFGWPGVLLGMAIIGAAVGTLGCRFNLAEAKTVTGLLVIVITIKQVIVAMEGSFSPTYVVWFRSLGAVAILHFLFARVSVNMKTPILGHANDATPLEPSVDVRVFPNLLR